MTALSFSKKTSFASSLLVRVGAYARKGLVGSGVSSTARSQMLGGIVAAPVPVY